ncbi:MAG: PstS family phosphate ABC transporter substrate-binding protein [Azonexus sp.]|uniref:PstS family phosphate ABC transporter substrate-binding protein n=1 Tax=Azonexus sp. TaxID=1872668 RepID=UPI00282575FD|nr:PstS family phosphate ABC transporter substrate-binding protein [Azonexus sp.]MDR0777216.1 PstS family phosphate ABC transporter substrate-binding protein [Azonexus sp.]
MFKTSQLVSTFAVAGLTLFGAQAAHAQIVKIDGSSTVYPITEAVAEDFQKAKKNAVKVTVGISGTGGGFKKFCRDEIDISNASRPITAKEMEDCKAAGVEYVEMPIAYDALTIVVNPKNTFLKQATIEELKKLWEPAAQGKITRWNQVNPAWPDAPVKLFGAGADSGTFEYFTEAVVGKAKSSRGDYTASEDDNVLVQGVARDINAIGYFGYAYYAENMSRLKGLPIVNPKTGKAVEPSGANVENASYQPLSRPIFIYVKQKSLEKPEIREFVEFYMKNADQLVREVKYVPLPKAIYDSNVKHAKDKKVGSVFGGKNEIGITVEEIMKREAKM